MRAGSTGVVSRMALPHCVLHLTRDLHVAWPGWTLDTPDAALTTWGRGARGSTVSLAGWSRTSCAATRRRFEAAAHLQQFVSVPGLVQNLFRVGRHLLQAVHHRLLRRRAFQVRNAVSCASWTSA